MSDPFYRTHEWQSLRARVVRASGYRCAWCRADVRGRGMARVDHVKPRAQRPDLALEPLNLRVLCTTCDNRRHASKPWGERTTPVNAEGWPTDPAHHWNRKR